jgi:hypothetical protein
MFAVEGSEVHERGSPREFEWEGECITFT